MASIRIPGFHPRDLVIYSVLCDAWDSTENGYRSIANLAEELQLEPLEIHQRLRALAGKGRVERNPQNDNEYRAVRS